MVFVALSLLIIQSSPVLTRMTNTIMNVIRVRIVLMAVLQENPDLLFSGAFIFQLLSPMISEELMIRQCRPRILPGAVLYHCFRSCYMI